MATKRKIKRFASKPTLDRIPREAAGWTIQDKLEEIQAKIKIKEGHCEWFAEKAKIQTEKQLKDVHNRRIENKALRLETHKALNPHPRIIGDAMRYEKLKHYALSHVPVPKAIEWVDLESIDMEKACDELIFIRQKREEKLEAVKEKLASLNSIVQQEKTKLDKIALKRIHYLQNRIQKTVTKEDTANFVMTQYLVIAEILENDMIYFDKILEQLEGEIKEQKAEERSFQSILRDGILAKKETQRLYKQAEREAAEKAAEPERKLLMLRLEANSLIEFEMTKKRSRPDLLETDFAADEAEKTILRTRDMLKMYEDTFKLLKDAMMASNIKQISIILMSQEWARDHLTEEINKHKEKVNVLVNEYDLLEETYLEVIDLLDAKIKKMKETEEEIMDRVEKEKESIEKTQDSLNALGNLLAKLKGDVNHLLKELEKSELVIPGEGEEVSTQTSELLEQCESRMKNLVNDIKDLIHHLQTVVPRETFEEFLDGVQATNATTKRYVNYPGTKAAMKPLALHETEDDEDVIIREMIKKTSEKNARKMRVLLKRQRVHF